MMNEPRGLPLGDGRQGDNVPGRYKSRPPTLTRSTKPSVPVAVHSNKTTSRVDCHVEGNIVHLSLIYNQP